jgi:phosphoribosylaminoimidazole-succinocarboxamide synthase
MTDEWIQTISQRYIELYERLIGQPFQPQNLSVEEMQHRIEQSINPLMA